MATADSLDEPPPATSPIPHANIAPAATRSPLSENPKPSSRLHLLVVANGSRETAYAQAIAVRLSKDPKVAIRVLVDDVTPRMTQTLIVRTNYDLRVPESDPDRGKQVEAQHRVVAEMVEWADFMVLCPIDADHLAKMMSGHADTMILAVLRSWDASKRIVLVPGMSTTMWENPVTKRQMSKLHRKWHWVRVLPPILWHYEHVPNPPYYRRVVEWSGLNEVLGIIKNQADLLNMGLDVDVSAVEGNLSSSSHRRRRSSVADDDSREEVGQRTLPPEIWTIILEYTNDWELAQALGVFTTLEMPESQGWRLQPKDPADPLQVFMHRLEWSLLTADAAAICPVLETAPPGLSDLSALAIKLIFKFCLTDVLSYIEGHCPIVFRNFDGKTVPTKASAYFGRTDILDWWARSPSFLEKQYDAEAMDGASRNGYVHVLEWWRCSGLPLKYTDAALEQASIRGHLRVLDWWRDAGPAGGGGSAGNDGGSGELPMLTLKPGKSVPHAAGNGNLEVLRWWVNSGVAFEHGDMVCKMASRSGHVRVLELWRRLRGDDDVVFQPQILADATVHAYVDVLEWWRLYARGELPGMTGRPSKRVEYRTMDIEEALEDSLGDQVRVRRWWAENGLNLGLGTSEWMKARYL